LCVVFSEVGYGFVVGGKFFGEPYDFEVAVTFAFEFSAGSDLVEVSGYMMVCRFRLELNA
jgi:hypothetical protein